VAHDLFEGKLVLTLARLFAPGVGFRAPVLQQIALDLVEGGQLFVSPVLALDLLALEELDHLEDVLVQQLPA